jgi:hypothetical protein
MASLWKRSNSKYFVACFDTVDGRQLKRSTGTTDRRKARAIADQFERAAQTKRTTTQVRKVIADLHRDLTGEILAATTVRQFITGWLNRKRVEVPASTIAFYTAERKRFLTWLGDRADADLASISRSDLLAFRNAVR